MPDPAYVLGINAYHGDVSAVLLRDGAVVAALEEERFRRIKHYAGFPTASTERCPVTGGIAEAGVAHVTISRDPKADLTRKAACVLRKRPGLQEARVGVHRTDTAFTFRPATPLANPI